MKRLSKKQVQDLISEMQQAAIGPDWEAWHTANVSRQALLEFPMGELWNPDILGFLWAWKLQGKLISKPIAKSDRFATNGLEGKISVQMCLTIALLAWRELPEHRRLLSLI